MKKGPISPAFYIAIFYLTFGWTWIIVTDHLLALLAGSNLQLATRVQDVKGLLFVAASACVLYLLVKKFHSGQQRSLKEVKTIADTYQALYESIADGIIEYDLKTDTAQINERLRADWGYDSCSVENFCARHLDRVHPDDRQRIQRIYQHTLAVPSAPWQLEYRFLWKDGSYHDIISRGYFITHPKTGAALRFAGTFTDVSELKTVKAQLVNKELQYRRQIGLRAIKAQEEERNRLAMELHDNVCQLLTVAKLYLEQLDHHFDAAMLPKVKGIVMDAASELRQLSFSMKPPEFGESSLFQALDILVERMSNGQPFCITVDYSQAAELNMTDEHRLMIYRIVQEQLNNIVKHAQARQVTIYLSNTDQVAAVTVSDDGKGFDTRRRQLGIGLKNMRNRLELFKGDLEVSSQPGKGCTLMANFMLH